MFFFSEGTGGVSSLPVWEKNGVSGIEVVYLWGPPLLASDLDSQCLALCVRFILLNIVELAVVELWYWRSTVWYLGSQSLSLSLEECQGSKAAPALSD